MKRFISASLSLILLLLAIVPASATDFEDYRDHDVQSGSAPYTTHWVPGQWYFYQWYGPGTFGTTLKWRAESGVDDRHVQSVLDGWIDAANRTGNLEAEEVSNSEHLFFRIDWNNDKCLYAYPNGCVQVTSWWSSSQREVSTWQKATIWEYGIASYYGETAHKPLNYNMVGMALGMREQWINRWDCNNDETSIMDGIHYVGHPVYDTIPCDTAAPNNADQDEYDVYWNGTDLNYIYNGRGINGDWYWYAFRDGFWNERKMVWTWLYSYDGNTWYTFAVDGYYNDIGSYYEVDDRSLQYNIQPGAWGVPSGVWIQACVQAAMTPSISEGWMCGPTNPNPGLWYN